jgi:hypothetical protein
MISTFSKIFPYILLLYFLIRSVKKPIYLIGIPFLLFMHFSIFFENVKIFTVPGRLSTDVLFAIWMIIIWMVIKIIDFSQLSRKNENIIIIRKRNSMDYIVICLMIISIVDLSIVYIQNLHLENVFTEFITIFSLFIGFFVVKEVFRNHSPGNISDFLFSIVLVNSLASCLYILHQGLHIGIYLSEEYLSEVFQGEIITRTFWFMPPLWFFSICYLVTVKKGKSILFLVLIIINLLAIFISYTRSFLLITICLVFVYYLLNAYKNKSFYSAAKNIIVSVIIGLVLFIVVSKIFPRSTGYFLNRFTELKQGIHSQETNSLLYRFSRTGEIFKKIELDKLFFGYGPVTEIQSPLVSSMRIVTWDLVWTGIVFRWGLFGMLLFLLLYLVSIAKAFTLFLKRDGITSQLALMLLLVIVSQLIESVVSSTFLSSDRYAMALWYFGLLAALLIADKNFEDGVTKVQN